MCSLMTSKKKPDAAGRAARPRNRHTSTEPQQQARPAGDVYVAAVGRRKTAVARVRLTVAGSADFTVNGLPMLTYFRQPELQQIATSPLTVAGNAATVTCSVRVEGGGYRGQAEAVRHGIARALLKLDAGLRPTLKPLGYLRRDPRAKERKKPGLRRARRAPQWAKR